MVPFLYYKCGWDVHPKLNSARGFFVCFDIVVGLHIYALVTVLVLIAFAKQIYLQLLLRHLFIFIPAITYAICYIPYTIVINTKNENHFSSIFEKKEQIQSS